MRQSVRFSISPSLALQYAFEDAKRRTGRRALFCKLSRDSGKGYNVFRYDHITEDELKSKDYYIDFWDYQVGIFFTNEKCDPDCKREFFTNAINDFDGVL